MERPRTVGELKQSGYRPLSVKQELRKNLITKLRRGESLFPGMIGYEDTVIPQVVHAILSGHDMLFLGLRGQGKTRMLRQLSSLLDEAIPVVAGSEVRDDPLQPMSRYARERLQREGDACPIEWVGREERYHEKLATPDVTIADLLGEIDLVKHAQGRTLDEEGVLHFGLIPRSHRGIFCINELPDLTPRIQVGLFNILEERDIQIRGYPVRLPVDVCLVFSANPEDYTNRGRIVTPLKDRIGSVIRTHYPATRELGLQIVQAEARWQRDTGVVHVPQFLREVLEEVVRLARTSPHVNQSSGVSVRMSIANYENVVSSAERRSLQRGEQPAVARCVDLAAILASSRGKLELLLSEEPGQEDSLLMRIIDEAIKTVFDQRTSIKPLKSVVEAFAAGTKVELGDSLTAEETLQRLQLVPDLLRHAEQLARNWQPELFNSIARKGLQAAVAEFLLLALYAHNRLNRTVRLGTLTFMV
ncbi:MAG: magnesium chelatase [Planctomycetaceae bacterium]|nr:MAG: magnesium chelatase [Planctomycetaceae bacterium]